MFARTELWTKAWPLFAIALKTCSCTSREGSGSPDDTWRQRSERLLTSSPCEAVYIIPGKRRNDGKLLVTAARGPHCRAAIELSAELAEQQHRRLTSLYVQPDIGPDAVRVGERIQSRLLDNMLPRSARQTSIVRWRSRTGQMPESYAPVRMSAARRW